MATTRIYAVEANGVTRLVRAANKVQAINHGARATITAEVATQDELIASVSAGVKVEDTQAEETPDPE